MRTGFEDTRFLAVATTTATLAGGAVLAHQVDAYAATSLHQSGGHERVLDALPAQPALSVGGRTFHVGVKAFEASTTATNPAESPSTPAAPAVPGVVTPAECDSALKAIKADVLKKNPKSHKLFQTDMQWANKHRSVMRFPSWMKIPAGCYVDVIYNANGVVKVPFGWGTYALTNQTERHISANPQNPAAPVRFTPTAVVRAKSSIVSNNKNIKSATEIITLQQETPDHTPEGKPITIKISRTKSLKK